MRSRLARRQAAASVTGEGVVLTSTRPEAVVAWARRGLGPLVVAPVGRWTLVAPAGRPKARYPYDDAVRTLAGRPASRRMRPAVGFFRVGRQAVVTVHPPHRWAATRWLIWTPRDGVVRPRGLPVATPEDVVHAAGRDSAETIAAVTEIVGDVGASAQEILAALLGVLDLPGVDVLTGAVAAADLVDARLVVPHDRYARAFDRVVRERDGEQAEDVDDAEGPAAGALRRGLRADPRHDPHPGPHPDPHAEERRR
ncbi:hypothetical protein [Mobilicoccus pelagius]|uniref:Uncharacterized protein n=1 Tax=Mobilicoccus pelagius NBRC 104925 TaxID=1089455 RepID=H5UPJ4_9MICO|nr:hypothetical protein [Mobilicoccus pelagius]GAB47652.1 hypothetical protein MOPEL_022_00210 [Mobilicoccus pelagius NBRC 104925]